MIQMINKNNKLRIKIIKLKKMEKMEKMKKMIKMKNFLIKCRKNQFKSKNLNQTARKIY
jgi:hypothetical protein